MIVTKTKARRSLDEAIKQIKNRKKINWEMAAFRHELYKAIPNFKTACNIIWKFDIQKQLLTCVLFFLKGKYRIECTYNHKTKTVSIWNIVTDFFQIVKVEKFAEAILKAEPKLKVIIKKKEE